MNRNTTSPLQLLDIAADPRRPGALVEAVQVPNNALSDQPNHERQSQLVILGDFELLFEEFNALTSGLHCRLEFPQAREDSS